MLTDSADVLNVPEQAAGLGLSPQQAEDIRQGALDMGLSQCADPHNSPYGRLGQLCPVAPLRCLGSPPPSTCPSCCCSPTISTGCGCGCPRSISPSCEDKVTPTSKPSWPTAPMRREPWPASTSTPVRRSCIYRWPPAWSSAGEPAATVRPNQQHFHAQESVIQSHPLLAEGPVPQFGDTEQWNLNGVVRRPARLPACAWTLVFSRELAEPSWNLLAREVSMIMLNPRHPSVTAAGISLKPAPAHPTTVIGELSHLRQLSRFAEASGLPPHPSAWCDSDLRRLTRGLREQRSSSSIRHSIETFKMLHQYGRAHQPRTAQRPLGRHERPRGGTNLDGGGRVHSGDPTQQWFPLIRAAWTYVHTFAPDILRALQRYRDLLAQATAMTPDQHRRTPPGRPGLHPGGELEPADVDARLEPHLHSNAFRPKPDGEPPPHHPRRACGRRRAPHHNRRHR